MPPEQLLILMPEAIFADPSFYKVLLMVVARVFILGQMADGPIKMITEGDRVFLSGF